MSPTEDTVAGIWKGVIKGAVRIDPDDSFFDLGGHSIIAQTMLFKVRKQWQDIDVSMTTIFEHPTLRGFAGEIDRAQDPIGLRLDTAEQINGMPEQHTEYAVDAQELAKTLPSSFPPSQLDKTKDMTVFLTGATGFLGAYILRDLLTRRNPTVKVIAHVRATDPETGSRRIANTCKAYGIWQREWSSRISCVTGDLSKPKLGMTESAWLSVAEEADLVVHNGARVHWVMPYASLREPNVLSTMACLVLCAMGKPKRFGFVSSTSVLDTEHFVRQSETGKPVSENDELEGSSKGLGTGYGQSKWASEFVVREAGRRGLRGAIVRPGYVTGDSETGVTNTDDYLVRLLKGCVQLKSRPDIANGLNMVPVAHVARVVVASTVHPPKDMFGVCQVTGHPRMRFDDFVGCLETYGYEVPEVEYRKWCEDMAHYVDVGPAEENEEHALLPLFHHVTSDLPNDSKAPELDDGNAAAALKSDEGWTGEDVSGGRGVDEKMVGVYLAYLFAVGFLKGPSAEGKARLPAVELSGEQREAMGKIGGRGGAA